MSNTLNFWTIIEIYSMVQGYFLAIYTLFFLRRPYLTVLLVVISTLIVAHLYYHFEWYYQQPHFVFLEAPLWYLIGPLFYFFILKLFNRTLRWHHLLHLIPFGLFTIFIVPFYFLGGKEKLEVLNSIFGKETYREDINRYLFTAHIFIYIMVSYLIFNKESGRLKEHNSKSTLIIDNVVSYALKYYLIFSFSGFVTYLLVSRNYELSNVYYDFYYVGLSFLIHFIFYYSLLRSNDEGGELEFIESKKYSSSSLSDAELDTIISKVTSYIHQFDIYKNPELRLRMVSEELKIPAHHISQAINQNLGKTFFDLINECRVKGVQKNIHDSRFRNYTLAGIASEHGFKSSSSFYRIFKKHTGKTPKEYFSQL